MRKFFSLIACVALFTGGLTPTPGFAQETSQVPDVQYITRGEFIAAAVSALKITTVTKENPKIDSERIPASQLPAVRAAYNAGALGAFTTPLHLNRAITRGEALQVIMVLGKFQTSKGASEFTDVESESELAKAVNLAIEKKWLAAAGRARFGVAASLSKQESAILLRAVTKAIRPPASTPVVAPSIRINPPTTSSSNTSREQLFKAIWDILERDYYYKDKLDREGATFKAAEALVNSANDPYTVFMPPAQTKNFNATIFEGNVSGIGAQVEQKKNAAGEAILLVVSPLRGSPAEKAGVKPGDQIIEVNGVTLKGLSFDEAVDKVRGPKGSVAKLKIIRAEKEMTIDVTRDNVSIPEIDVSYNGTVAIVKLQQFGKITNDQFRKTIQTITEKKATGFILDLRNNPGGLVNASERVMSAFLPKGSVFSVIHDVQGKDHIELTNDERILDPNIKMIVLINKGSASASEIVAGALQDAGRARVLGEKSFGKGTVQTVYSLKGSTSGDLAGSSLKVTTGEWKTPNGRSIDKHGVDGAGGIIPDLVVADTEADPDASLRKALELLR